MRLGEQGPVFGDLREPDALARCLEGVIQPAGAGLTLRQLEDLYIEQVLALTGGRKGEAAELLGVDRKTLYRRGAGGDAPGD